MSGEGGPLPNDPHAEGRRLHEEACAETGCCTPGIEVVARGIDVPYGYMGFHATQAPNGEFEATSITDADRAAGWTEIPLFDRDAVLEFAATICEEITSWGLSPTKLEVAESTRAFCAKAIRAQRSDSDERKRKESAHG